MEHILEIKQETGDTPKSSRVGRGVWDMYKGNRKRLRGTRDGCRGEKDGHGSRRG